MISKLEPGVGDTGNSVCLCTSL